MNQYMNDLPPLNVHIHSPWPWPGRLNSGLSDMNMSDSISGEADFCLFFDQSTLDDVACDNSNIRIALLWEPREIVPGLAERFELISDRFDFTLTHDQYLLSKLGTRASPLEIGGSYIPIPSRFLETHKSRLLSISASRKRITDGHRLRHDVIEMESSISSLQVMGGGYRPYKKWEAPYKRFMYSISIENSKHQGNFTEKLIHPLLMGTVPIYWGPAALPLEFEEQGIIRFSSLDELRDIISGLDRRSYKRLKGAVRKNWLAALKYASGELNVQRLIATRLGLENYAQRYPWHFTRSGAASLPHSAGSKTLRSHLRPNSVRFLERF